MIKKINIIIVGIIAFISCTAGVSASCEVAVEYNAHATNFGYSTQNQSCKNIPGVELYCLDKGYKNAGKLSQCQYVEVTGSAYETIANLYGDHDIKEVAYRYYSYRVGIAKAPLSQEAVDIKIGENIPSNMKNQLNALNTSVSRTVSSIIGFTQNGVPTISGGNAIFTINVKTNGYDMNNLEFKVTNGRIIVTNETKLTISVPFEECIGASFKITASLKGGNNAESSISETSKKRYFIALCPDNKQNYLVEVPAGTLTTTVFEDDDSSNGNGTIIGTGDFSIGDPECECGGSTDLAGSCKANENNYYVKDSESIKKCIITGKYAKYCGDSIKKEDDNEAFIGKTKVAESEGIDTNITLRRNDYCGVYCTENIDYNLPGIIKTNNGGYFKLTKDDKKIKLTGTRTCYTSNIKISDFVEDITTEQEKLIENYNKYLENKAKAKSAKKATKGSIDCSGSCKNAVGTKVTTSSASGNKYTPSAEEYKEIKFDINIKDGSISIWKSEASATADAWQATFDANTSCSSPLTGTICGSKTAEADTVDKKETYYNGLAGEALNDAKDNYKNIIKILNKYKSCHEWNNNYCFDPIINFSYDEVYNDMIAGELAKTKNSLGENVEYISGQIEDDYSGNGVSGYSTDSKKYLYLNGESLNTQVSKINTTANYVKKSKTEEVTFEEAKEVFTYAPYGTISMESNCGGTSGNCISLGNVIPVALEKRDKNRIYQYYLDITNIGQTGNDARCNINNRIMGEGCSLYDTVKESLSNSEYTCQYVTEDIPDCPECDIECVCPEGDKDCYVEDKICKWDKEPCPTCDVSCVGCLWSNGDTAYGYRTVSLNDVFPNTETDKVGYNWNTSNGSDIKKAKNTIDDIEDAGQEVYKTPQYSYVLTPQIMKQIREYNKGSNNGNNNNIPKGGYNSDTLSCTNGKECKSSFLNLEWMTAESVQKNRNTNWTEYESTGKSWK